MLNDFRNLGFNQAENGKKVFDGMMQWIAAGDGINMNYRFSQPGRTERNRQDHLYVEGVFPFANVTTTDPITGKTDSRYDTVHGDQHLSARDGDLLGQRVLGEGRVAAAHRPRRHAGPARLAVRAQLPHLEPSARHGQRAPTKGNCQQFQNPLDSAPVQRALFVALDEWSTQGHAAAAEPGAEARRRHAGAAAAADRAWASRSIPGVTYTGLKTTRYLLNYGPDFYTTGIATINPPAGHAAVSGQPGERPDLSELRAEDRRDGNDIAGVRLPDVTVPLATYTGWALRAGRAGERRLRGLGPVHPVREDQGRAHGVRRSAAVDRGALSDVRRSTTRRCVDAIDDLVRQRLMLCEDADDAQSRLLAAGLAAGVPGADGKLPPQANVPHCHKLECIECPKRPLPRA